jgi:uncharacterized membrane protein YhaH (DUF805 family)
VEQNQPAFWLALKDGLNRYADFSGVSTRSQYWYFILTTNIAVIIAQLSFGDVGKSGWFILVPIYNIILFVTPSKQAGFSL